MGQTKMIWVLRRNGAPLLTAVERLRMTSQSVLEGLDSETWRLTDPFGLIQDETTQ